MKWTELSPAFLVDEYKKSIELKEVLLKFIDNFVDNKNNTCERLSDDYNHRQVEMILGAVGRLVLTEEVIELGEMRDALEIMAFYPQYAGGMIASWSFVAKAPIDKWAYSFRGQLFGNQRQVIRDVYEKSIAETTMPQIVEVGCHLGRGSTREALGALMDKPFGGKMHCIDIWPNDPFFGEMKTAFLANIDLYGASGLVRTVHAQSDEGLSALPDRSADVIFIDGGHEYATVKKDIEIALQKIKPEGVIFGHDCEGRPEQFKSLAAGKDQDVMHDIWVSDPGPYGPRAVHAGVVLAVDEIFEGKAEIRDDIWIFDLSSHRRDL